MASRSKKPAAKTKAKAKPAAKTKAKPAAKAKTKTKAKTKPKAKTKAKAVPSVSPLRGTSLDDYVVTKKLGGWQAEALAAIRALVARVAPKATVSIKWGQPVWDHNGPFAWARPAAKHLSFGFWRGADLADPTGLLEGTGAQMRHVKLTRAEDATRAPLEALVKEAVQLNVTKGNPTRR